MICSETRVKICDNSGAKIGYVIHVNGSTGKSTVSIGERVKISLKVVEPNITLKKGNVVSALVVRVRKSFRRKDGTDIFFGDNAVILINEDGVSPMGTRIFGPIPREIGDMGFQKIISLAQEVV